MKELLFKRKRKFFLYFIACFFPIISDLLRILLMGLIFDAVEIKQLDYFYKVVYISIGFLVVTALLYISSRLLRISFMRDTILDVRIAAFDKIINTSYKQFSKVSKDVYISNLINDINDFEKNFFINLLNFIYSTGLYIASAIIMAFINLIVMAIVVGVSIIIFIFARLTTKQTEKLQRKVSKNNEDFTLNITNTFNGLEILKLNNIETKFLRSNLDSINKVERSKFKFRIFSETQKTFSYMLGSFTVMGVLIYLLIRIKSGYSFGDIAVIVMFSGNMAFALQNIFPRLNVIKSSRAIYKKITEYENVEKERERTKPFKFNDKIEIKDLTFSHEDRLIFNNASCTIEKGKKYLIKGASGVGKSTLIKLLTQTYDDFQGEIIIDGVDVRDINEKSYSSNVSFIYQDVFLFADTLRNNITLYKDLADKVIVDAIKKAGLEEFVKTKENGIEEVLAENGKNLSGGERQRVSIARAIAKGANILFVDEGTSALNEELGALIEQTFLDFKGTVIAISHRTFANITNKYDYVLEIKNGKINTFTGKEYFEEDNLYV